MKAAVIVDTNVVVAGFPIAGNRLPVAAILQRMLNGEMAFLASIALLDVLVTPEAVSSDAKSGLAWVPDLQPLGAWDDAERKWRGGPAA